MRNFEGKYENKSFCDKPNSKKIPGMRARNP